MEKHSDTAVDPVHLEVENSGSSNSTLEVEAQRLDPDPQDFKWDAFLLFNIGALYLCFFTTTWALLVPTSSIPFIVEAYPAEAHLAAWIAAAAAITNCVVQSFIGALSDILGRKAFLLVGMLLGTVGNIISSRANGITPIIGGQVLNGCGITLGWLCVPLVSEMVPKSRRPVIQGLGAILSGMAILSGPVVQGVFIKQDVGGPLNGWRVGFYMTAGFYAASGVLIGIFYKPGPRPNADGLSTWQRFLKVDWVGILLVTTGLVLFLIGLQYGGSTSWTSPLVLCTLIIGAISLVAFGVYDWKFQNEGILRHELFQHRNYAISLALNIVGGIVLFGGQAYLPQEAAHLLTSDAIMVSVYNIPFNGVTIVSAIVAGFIMANTKEARPIILVASVMLLVGSGLMAVMEPEINFAAWFFPTTLLGIGVGIVSTILTVVVSICTPDQFIAHAISLVASARALGGSIGIVIFNQIFISKQAEIIPRVVNQALTDAGLSADSISELMRLEGQGLVGQLSNVSGVNEQILAVYSSARASGLADSYRFIWYTLIPFAAINLVLSFFLKSTKAQMTMEVASAVQRK